MAISVSTERTQVSKYLLQYILKIVRGFTLSCFSAGLGCMPTRTFLGSCSCVSSADTMWDGWSYTATALLSSVFLKGPPKQVSGQLKPAKSHTHWVSWPKKSWEPSGNQELILEWFVESFNASYFTSHGLTMCLFLFSILCDLSSFVQCWWVCWYLQWKYQHCCVTRCL